MALKVSIVFFWIVIPCCLIDDYQLSTYKTSRRYNPKIILCIEGANKMVLKRMLEPVGINYEGNCEML